MKKSIEKIGIKKTRDDLHFAMTCYKEMLTDLYENEIAINLTKSERNLLYLLINNRGEKITHNQIEEFVYNGVSKTSVAVRTLIKRLRAKLPKDSIKNSLDEGYYIK